MNDETVYPTPLDKALHVLGQMFDFAELTKEQIANCLSSFVPQVELPSILRRLSAEGLIQNTNGFYSLTDEGRQFFSVEVEKQA